MAQLKNLIVEGNSSLIGNVAVNTINNVTVGANPKFTDTTYTFDGTYNSSTNKAATVSTVTNAINALDGGTIGTPGTGKTITALSQTDGNISATFGDISITKSLISDFPTIPTVNNAKFSVKGAGTEVASTTANASTPSSIDIVADGDNVTVTPDATNNKIKIAATNTTYKFTIGSTTNGDSTNGVSLGVLESKTAAASGTDLSLVTTGEKNTWNSKQSALTNPVTRSGSTALTANKIVLGNGNNTVIPSSYGITTTAPSSTSNDTTIPTSKAVWNAVSNGIAANDAMVYKTTIDGGSTGEYGALTPAADKGHTYKVSAAGKINGVVVEVGDMLICNTDSTAAATSSNYNTIVANWDFILTNIDGAVTGPTSSTDDNLASFNGAAGKVIKDSGLTTTNVSDAVSKKHSHSSLTLSTTAQAYDGTHTLALPSSDPYSSARTPASHKHGNIQNGGTLLTNDITIANGDKLVVTDSSNSNKVARTSVSFDGSTTTKALTLKGTFETFATSNTTYKFTIGSTTKGDSTSGVDLGTLKSETAAESGTTLSLVTTGEKATWNAKQNALTFTSTPSSTNKVVTLNDVPSGDTYKLSVNGNTNGDSNGTNLGTLYAPTTAGTNGQILKSNGSGAPTWISGVTYSTTESNITAIDGTIIGTALRKTAQSLSSTEKTQVLTNLGIASTISSFRNIIVSTSEPTSADGNDGDIWLVYET